MTDDVAGAVRRTQRPTPDPRPTGDHQTLETVAQPGAGTTNAPTPVSADAGNGTDDLSPEVAAALVERHGPELEALAEVARHGLDELRDELAGTFEGVPGSVVFGHVHTTDDDMQAFVELPDCTACGGTGKDDHGTPFEAPLAVHFAGMPVKAEGRRRQLCMWCGHVLSDVPSRKGELLPPAWLVGTLVRVEDGVATEVDYEPAGELPPGCCALPDDGEPACICSVESTRCPDCRDEDQADDDEPVDGWDGVAIPATCGKHVPGTSSNRCLLRPGHTGDCSDEFEDGPAETPSEEDVRALRMHLASVHKLANAFDLLAADLDDVHQHDHFGPCGLRNHDVADRSYDEAEARAVVAEADAERQAAEADGRAEQQLTDDDHRDLDDEPWPSEEDQ